MVLSRETLTICTIGHSTHDSDKFVAMLRSHGVEQLIDIRTVPRSRRNPQFHAENLSKTLAGAGIDYVHMPSLGGLRKPWSESPNTGLEDEGLRGFADYMQTDAFEQAIGELLKRAAPLAEPPGRTTLPCPPTAIMCAEASPWKCHRSLVSDALAVHGCQVRHIMNVREAETHRLTSWARLDGLKVGYPPAYT